MAGMQDKPAVFTIGHSNHPLARFIDLLRGTGGTGVTAVADVRSIPYSRRWPQFGRPALERSLGEAGIAYVFLGAELGGKRDDPALLRDGRVDYDRVAATESFRTGLDRVEEGARRHRVALMCAEREPLDCHRFLLVARRLHERAVPIEHILADGTIEKHDATERRLLAAVGLNDLFSSGVPPRDAVARAYALRSAKRLAGRR
ncbi:MAG TPA: DUF488 domain-containing protein [Methylomirabilota bacterium]|nr:DUF488 domain-containing protein [Methylomirabilota bacterium]